MANDSTHAGVSSSVEDTTPHNEDYFTDMQGEDAFFGPEQLAQATEKVVPVPQGENVIRVQVNPGEIIELSSPFDPGATLLAREGDGNLAIRVGDVTVILQGYVDANQASPVVIQSSDGQPIDIAILLASTDPTIDIQTAAGPGDAAGAQGQGADNTGGILSQLAGGNGLGGLNAVGAQDATSLKYGTIDNSIRLDREDALLATSSGLTPFRGLAEPFLRDPVHHGAFASFHDFELAYGAAVNNPSGPNPGPGWADFEGTQADGNDLASYLLQTSFTSGVIPGSNLVIRGADLQQFLDDAHITSDGSDLCVEMRDGDQTAFVLRQSDKALILVIHVANHGDGLVIDTYLIDRVDHHDQGADQLAIDIPYQAFIVTPQSESEGTFVQGTTSVNILDDVPVSEQTDYFNAIHTDKDLTSCFLDLLGGKYDLKNPDHDAGKADEDYIFKGNHDKDNATGPDSDPLRGDESGGKIILGQVHVNFGADGPSGAIPHGDSLYKPLPGDPILTVATPQALHIDGYNVGDSVPGLTSQGHPLVVLQHELISIPTFFGTIETVEMVKVGYHPDITGGGGNSETLTSFESESCDTTVFTLFLQTGPNLPLFGGFAFELCQPLDHPVSGTLEGGDVQVVFKVVATDDDGDNPVSAPSIVVKINDDAPYAKVEYCNTEDSGREVKTAGLDGSHVVTYDFGHVDEDWLRGGGGNTELVSSAGVHSPGNQDQPNNANQDGDDIGHTHVSGKITLKYGADGPSDTVSPTLGLTGNTTGAAFHNVDGSTVTSHGHVVEVLNAGPGFLEAGYHDGEDIVSVFTLTLTVNSETKADFDFCLTQPLDHDPATGPDGPESNILLTFKAGSLEDFDHDPAEAVIQIKVNDDKPEIGICYFNNLEHDFSLDVETEGLARLAGAGANDVIKTEDFGHVDEDWLKGGYGNSVTYIGNQDEDGNHGSNADKFGDDIGKSEVCGQITVKYGGDGPADGSQPFGLAVYTIPDFPDPIPNATKQQIVDQTLAYNATIPVFKNVDGSTVSSGGVELQVLVSEAGHLQVGTPAYFTIIDNILTLVPGTVTFDLTFDPGSGKFDLKLFGPIDHDPVQGPDGPESNSLLTFKVGDATDFDGDTAEAVIKIQVNDDHPEVGVTYVNNDGYSSNTVGLVDEDHIFLNSTANQDTDSTPGDTDGKGTVFFDLTAASFGADGPGSSSQPIGFTAQENDTFTVKDDNGDPHTLTTADGHEVLAHVEDNGVGGFTLIGYFNSNDSKGFVDGTSTEVFTLAYNSTSNPQSGQFNLRQSLQHPLPNEDNLFLSFGIVTGPTDGDGDPAVAWINIQVNDDGPQAVDDTFTPDTDEPDVDAVLSAVPADYSGNVLDNDKKGADDAKVTGASSTTGGSQSADIDGDTTVAGALGLLILHANGEWEYTPTSGTAGGVDEFTYTITDGDGDTASAKLTITVPSDISTLAVVETGPTHSPADHYDRTVDPVTGLNGIVLDNKSTHFVDPTGGHVISGGSGNDFIEVTGNDGSPTVFGVSLATNGNGGDDIIHGGGGKDTLRGGAGDDTIYGGNNDDDLYGDAGHDAMDGGAGNDKIHVDADDFDGTNTLDGTHSIDGGDGYDTVDISGLKTFDATHAMRLENVEALAMDGKAGSGGTSMTLSYDSAYGITQVGGLHMLSITGDASGKGADTVSLVHGAGGETWSQIGSSNVYEAGAGASKVTVTVETGVHVELS